MRWKMTKQESRRIKPNRLWVFLCLALSATATLAQSTDDVAPLRPALSEMPPTVWEQHGVLIVALAVVVVLFAGVLIWWLLQPKPSVPVPIEIQTRRELEQLQASAQDARTLSRVSQVLKRYVAAAFGLSAGELTTTEFTHAVVGSEKVGNELAASVSDFLRQCDEQKFSLTGGVPVAACSRALELFQAGEARRAELRRVAKIK